jgi:hypothetical protein
VHNFTAIDLPVQRKLLTRLDSSKGNSPAGKKETARKNISLWGQFNNRGNIKQLTHLFLGTLA